MDYFELFGSDFEFIVLRKSIFENEFRDGGFHKEWNESNNLNNYNLIMVNIYMELHYNRGEIVRTNLTDLVDFCRQTIDTRKNRSVWRMRELLVFMESKGLINLGGLNVMDTKKVTKDTMFNIKYNKVSYVKENRQDKLPYNNRFGIIPITALKKILRYDDIEIIVFWCYIQVMKWTKNDLNENDIAPVLIRGVDDICNVLVMNDKKIKEYTEQLVYDGLLLYGGEGEYIKNGKPKKTSHVYITIDNDSLNIGDYKRWLNDGLKQHENFIRENYGDVKFNSKARIIDKDLIETRWKLRRMKEEEELKRSINADSVISSSNINNEDGIDKLKKELFG